MKKQLATLLAVTALGIGVLSGCGVSAASNSTGSSSDSAEIGRASCRERV